MPDRADDTWTGLVPARLAGSRLDQVLAELVPQVSRSQAGRLARDGHCLVDGAPASPGLKLRGGETLHLTIHEPTETVAPETIALDVLFEDEHLIAVNKPAGMTSHPARGTPAGTLLNALVGHLGSTVRPTLVHRLDRDTSGVLLAAKSTAAHRSLKQQADEGALKRIYWALVWGVPSPAAGTIDAPIGPDRGDKSRMAITDRGRDAVTHYTTLHQFPTPDGPVSLLQIRLETGRTHQIRVHFEHLGHPLLGERTYRQGAPALTATDLTLPGQALHSRSLSFLHPTTQAPQHIEAPPPTHWPHLPPAP